MAPYTSLVLGSSTGLDLSSERDWRSVIDMDAAQVSAMLYFAVGS